MEDEERYFGAIVKRYTKAVKNVTDRIAKNFAATLPEATYEEVIDKVLYIVYNNWNSEFIEKIDPDIRKHTSSLYTKYRKDKNVFNGMPNIPQVRYDLPDYRALEYFKDSDKFYLGRFITDESTIKKVTEYIKKEYLEQGGEIGRSAAMIEKFKENFEGVLNGEDWKIRRVIDTTVSRMRVTGALNYMHQADIQEYEVIELVDSKTCAYCEAMNGKRFSLETAYNKVSNMNFGDGSDIGEQFPFITALFKNAEEMSGMNATQLAAVGVGPPPYHPACRGSIIAVF